ncbi:hypothetical protein BABINDRAFT_160805 [Babjeviella inositovora NRRL Y-12698]|uniref:BIR-domain-containing protein n=1 Tax=Babjeviella inositovora NRRL Y-12698 TaxID=984486 RepID=A0A1E3QSQ3_9ASCO|nr:uncharacterized protein BABINDRAFT_160805 [Babjeviella inositovora NRRL Y-12698]ODQ80534.1 hypothetical protein BABINDRAFT_160805 [Babjeviella inositovora NRRL Y-12698]
MPPKNPGLFYRNGREETFTDRPIGRSKETTSWPEDGLYPTATQMALCGFYYTPTKASLYKATCFLCKRSETLWRGVENPAALHLQTNPECAWAQLISYYLFAESKTTIDWTAVPMFLEPFGKACYTLREQTFGRWSGKHHTKEDMLNAGFFFNPENKEDDCCQCMYCGVSLAGFEPEDDLFKEHWDRKDRLGVECYAMLKHQEMQQSDKRTSGVTIEPRKKRKLRAVTKSPDPVSPAVTLKRNTKFNESIEMHNSSPEKPKPLGSPKHVSFSESSDEAEPNNGLVEVEPLEPKDVADHDAAISLSSDLEGENNREKIPTARRARNTSLRSLRATVSLEPERLRQATKSPRRDDPLRSSRSIFDFPSDDEDDLFDKRESLGTKLKSQSQLTNAMPLKVGAKKSSLPAKPLRAATPVEANATVLVDTTVRTMASVPNTIAKSSKGVILDADQNTPSPVHPVGNTSQRKPGSSPIKFSMIYSSDEGEKSDRDALAESTPHAKTAHKTVGTERILKSKIALQLTLEPSPLLLFPQSPSPSAKRITEDAVGATMSSGDDSFHSTRLALESELINDDEERKVQRKDTEMTVVRKSEAMVLVPENMNIEEKAIYEDIENKAISDEGNAKEKAISEDAIETVISVLNAMHTHENETALEGTAISEEITLGHETLTREDAALVKEQKKDIKSLVAINGNKVAHQDYMLLESTRADSSHSKLVLTHTPNVKHNFIESSTPVIRDTEVWVPSKEKRVFELVSDMGTVSQYLGNVSASHYELNDDMDGTLTSFIANMPEEELGMTISEWIQYISKQGRSMLMTSGLSMLKYYEEEYKRGLAFLNKLPVVEKGDDSDMSLTSDSDMDDYDLH